MGRRLAGRLPREWAGRNGRTARRESARASASVRRVHPDNLSNT